MIIEDSDLRCLGLDVLEGVKNDMFSSFSGRRRLNICRLTSLTLTAL